MAVPNRISAVLSDESVAIITAATETINSHLPFLVDLSNEEIQDLPKFGSKSVGFVQNSLKLAQQVDTFLPRSFKVGEFKKDVELYAALYTILGPLRRLLEKLEDTSMLVGSEAYSGGLVVYNCAKDSRGDLAGLETVLDDLGRRFVQKSAPKSDDTPAQ